MFTDVIFDRRVAALELLLIPRPFKTRLAVWRCLQFLLWSSNSHWSLKPVKPSNFGRLISAVRRYPGGIEKLVIFFTLAREIPE